MKLNKEQIKTLQEYMRLSIKINETKSFYKKNELWKEQSKIVGNLSDFTIKIPCIIKYNAFIQPFGTDLNCLDLVNHILTEEEITQLINENIDFDAIVGNYLYTSKDISDIVEIGGVPADEWKESNIDYTKYEQVID